MIPKLEPGEWMMVALVCQYVIASALFAGSGNWPKMFYWIGAAIITLSVLAMK